MLIKRLHLKNLLSFKDTMVELGPLNVLIGPNAVGKSNLIEAISLLQATPTSLSGAILRGGGVRQWIWLGYGDDSPIAAIQCEMELPTRSLNGNAPRTRVDYKLEFAEDATGLTVQNEHWTDIEGGTSVSRAKYIAELDPRSVKRPPSSPAEMLVPPPPGFTHRFPISESLHSQVRHPGDQTPITDVGYNLSQIRIFREFKTGTQSNARRGVSTSVPKDALQDGSDNLALVLQELDFQGVHDKVRIYLQRFCERFEDVKINVGEGLARLYLREAGLSEMLSAIRMSDGTLKFLSLLAALFHPLSPSLICIEEPEIGLHPDALQLVAEALMDASETTQLIVTTHSEALIDALGDNPESVLVCERDFDNGTQMKRLSKGQLKEWLQRYTLGQLWRKGEIGGGRW